MNSLVRDHLPATFFAEYLSLRDQLLATLDDDDLGRNLGGATLTLGALCREIGEIETAYVESLRTFRQSFDQHADPRLESSVEALRTWYGQLDAELLDAVAALDEETIATRRIVRADFPEEFFSPLPAVQLDIYREALLIFYGKVSVYLRAFGRPLPGNWSDWIG